MGLRINTNVASIAVQRLIGQSQRKSEGAIKSLASGSRFDNPDTSSASHAIADKLQAQVKGLQAAKSNAENAYSFIQVAEGGLSEQNNILIRMRELAVQAASDTYSDTEREFLNQEYEQLEQEFDRIAETTMFGSNKLLSGENTEFEFQVGPNKGDENVITYKSDADTRSSSVGIDGTRVDDKSDARDALETLDEAIVQVAQARSNFGAIQSRLDSTMNNQGVQIENITAARSRIADTDVAEAVSDMYKAQALQQYQAAVLSQANMYPGSVLKLIG